MKRRIDAAVVDTSALVCIALDEPAAKLFLEGFSRTESLLIGAATRAETWLAICNLKGAGGAKMVDDLIEALKVKTIDFGADSLPHFRQGGAIYHHKHHEKARLNIGELFTYSLARHLDLPLFFQGTDFENTDLLNAMKTLGYQMSVKGVPFATPTFQR